jgi:hypothetical protein
LWTLLEPATFISAQGASLTRESDLSILSSGKRPDTDTYTVTADTDLKGITAVRLEILTDDSLPLRGPGRHDNGNPVLTEFRVQATPRADPRRPNQSCCKIHGRFQPDGLVGGQSH